MELKWSSSSRTDVGMVRELNEDALLDRSAVGLWVVADGMGGHTAGDVASRMICDRLAEIDAPASLSGMVDAVEGRLMEVNSALREMASRGERQTIGSTVVALLAHGRHAVCLWAGDSRAYRLRKQRLERISEDHALVQELVAKGVLTPEQAAAHPQANLVTRAVGAGDLLHVDAEIVELQAGDRFLLCSDGLDKEVSEAEIAGVLGQREGGNASEALVDLALARGSRDNVSVVAVEFEPVAGTTDGEQPPEEDTVPGMAGVRGSS